MDILQIILSLKSYILLPLLMLALALIMGARLLDAVKGALHISIAQIGISILSSFFIETSLPVINAITSLNRGGAGVTDVGWPVIAMLVWSFDVIYIIVPVYIAVNLLLLWKKWTNIINVDIWNYWHIAVASLIVYSATGSVLLVIIADIIMSAISIKLCEWANPAVKRYYRTERNQCVSTANSLVYLPVAIVMDWLIDKVPGIRKLNFQPKELKGELKVLLSPGFVALAAGLALSLGCGHTIAESLDFSVRFTAVFILLPQVLKFMKEGFSPVADATASFAEKKIGNNRKMYVGVNHLVVADDPSVIISTVLLIPVALLMGALISWIDIFPMGDLMNIVSIIIVIVAVCKGNVIRIVLTSIPVILLNFLLAPVVAPVYAGIAERISYDMGGVTGKFAASLNGSTYINIWLADLLQGRMYAILTMPLIIGAGYVCFRYYKKLTMNTKSIIN
ncbi:MAG: PTS transporter subunit IIC [Acetivibrionales bacterium]|jgi:PTS system galactitol-specific IIC component